MSDKVIFIHGLGSDSKATWTEMKKCLADETLSNPKFANLEVADFEYPTARVLFNPLSKLPVLRLVADALRAEITLNHADADRIVLVAHSLGGLVARKYLRDIKSAQQATPVKHLVMYATPNGGAKSSLRSLRRASETRLSSQPPNLG